MLPLTSGGVVWEWEVAAEEKQFTITILWSLI